MKLGLSKSLSDHTILIARVTLENGQQAGTGLLTFVDKVKRDEFLSKMKAEWVTTDEN